MTTSGPRNLSGCDGRCPPQGTCLWLPAPQKEAARASESLLTGGLLPVLAGPGHGSSYDMELRGLGARLGGRHSLTVLMQLSSKWAGHAGAASQEEGTARAKALRSRNSKQVGEETREGARCRQRGAGPQGPTDLGEGGRALSRGVENRRWACARQSGWKPGLLRESR